MKNKKLLLFFLFLIPLLLVFARPDPETENYRNADATNHTLLTVRALQSNPITEHRLLPTVTLGNPEKNQKENPNAFLPWAESTYPDKYRHGNYVYISFPPASFLIPFAYFTLTGLPVTEGNLQLLTIALSLLGWVFLVRLLLKLFPDLPEWLILSSSALSFFFLRETLHSTVAIYWAQTTWQVIFILQLSFFHKLYRNFSTKNIILFAILCFFSAFTEWTGFVGNFGFCLLLFGQGIYEKKRAKLWTAAAIALATLSAFSAILLHFSLLLDFNDILQGMRQRQSARTATMMSAEDLLEWFKSYWVSFGLLLPLLAVMIAANIRKSNFTSLLLRKIPEIQPDSPEKYGLAPLLFISTFVLLENFVVMSHAYLYRYDRIKGVFLLILLFLLFTRILKTNYPRYFRIFSIVLCVILALSCAWNYATYKLNLQSAKYKWAEDLSSRNRTIADLRSRYTPDNTLIAHPMEFPEIELLYLFNRNILEKENTPEKLLEIAKKQRKQYLLILESEKSKKYLGKSTLRSATVYDTETGTIREKVEKPDSARKSIK